MRKCQFSPDLQGERLPVNGKRAAGWYAEKPRDEGVGKVQEWRESSFTQSLSLASSFRIQRIFSSKPDQVEFLSLIYDLTL